MGRQPVAFSFVGLQGSPPGYELIGTAPVAAQLHADASQAATAIEIGVYMLISCDPSVKPEIYVQTANIIITSMDMCTERVQCLESESYIPMSGQQDITLRAQIMRGSFQYDPDRKPDFTNSDEVVDAIKKILSEYSNQFD